MRNKEYELRQYILHRLDSKIFDTKWISGTVKFVVVGGRADNLNAGAITIFQLNAGKLETIRIIQCKTPIRCAATVPISKYHDSIHLVVGDFEGKMHLIDLECGKVINTSEAHFSIINSIDTVGGGERKGYGATEIVTGGRDGSVKVWDVRQPDTPVAYMSALTRHEGGTGARDCWAVTFGSSFNSMERCVSAGFDNGDIKVFDLRRMKIRQESNVKSGICGLEYKEKYGKDSDIVATTVNDGLLVYRFEADLEQIVLLKSYRRSPLRTGPRATMWFTKHIPQNPEYFITSNGIEETEGSDFKNFGLQLWKHNLDGPQLKCEFGSLSDQPIHCFDWSLNRHGLGLFGSFDNSLHVVDLRYNT